MPRRVAAVLVDRANFGRMKPVLEVLRDDPEVELSIVCGGTMVLNRFGKSSQVLIEDGFEIASEVFMELEGSTPATMAKSVGLGIIEFTSEFQRLKPDVVLLIGDRYEALGATIAAAFMNLCIVHMQGGEVSGSIDESTRHAMSKFAHYHVPSTARSAEYLIRMGEMPESILTVGCPSSDLAKALVWDATQYSVDEVGNGAEIDLTKPFALSVFHPTTTDFGTETAQMDALLESLAEIGMPTLMLWPNIDAGSDQLSKAIRRFREANSTSHWLRIATNFEPDHYLALLSKAAIAVGNSSSFVRDASYFGTPVVLVGDRQAGRERGAHVHKVAPVRSEIVPAIRLQLEHGRYAPSTLYGDGNVSRRIVDGIKSLRPYSQKQLAYTQLTSEKRIA